MKKVKELFNNRLKYIALGILAVIAVLFIPTIFETGGLTAILPAIGALAWILPNGSFKELSEDELKELSADDLIKYYNEYNAQKAKERDALIESKASKDDLIKLQAQIVDNIEAQAKRMNELFAAQGIELKKLKTSESKGNSKNDFVEQLGKVAKDISENYGQRGMKTVKDNDGNKIQYKAVGTMTVSGSITGEYPPAQYEPGYNDTNKRQFTIRNFSNVGPISSDLIKWVYIANEEGGAGMTAEAAVKTQYDWEWIVDSAEVKKITSFVKVTKEMLSDLPNIMTLINNKLTYKINLLEETQLIAGTGLTVYLNGIEKYAQPLDNTGLAGTIATPNKWDVIGAAIKQISIETEGESKATAIFMNPADVFGMVHGSRTTTNEYNAPLAVVEPNGTRIYGLPVIETNSVTAGEFIVADMSKFNIRDREGLTISMGLDGNDFTYNLVTILAEKRLVSFVEKNDENAFVTDTFSDGITFLTAST